MKPTRPQPPKDKDIGPVVQPATQAKKTGLSSQTDVRPQDKIRYNRLHASD